ncbi:MAG: glycosyltransferase family 8 protein [Candidatus Gastranaerophilaceae bacterium]
MSNMHIAFTVNDFYVKYLSVAIVSILLNSQKDEKFNFYILNSGDITDTSKKNIDELKKYKDFNISWITVNTELFKNQGTNLREDVTIETNYRFLIASLFPQLDKLIFLDADLVVVGSLSELWNTNIDNYYMAARENEQPQNYLQSLNIKNNKYYNTGVMLCNLKLWRKNNIEPLFFENAKKYKNVCQFLDQDVLVITLQDKLLSIDKKWNNLSYKNEFNENSIILHWASENKPWVSTTVPGYKIYEKYAKFTNYYNDIVFNKYIHIAFTINDAYMHHLATTMASILSNANPDDKFYFYVINANDISYKNKQRIEKLKKIVDFKLEYVTVNNEQFKNYVTGCHISTNYRLKSASILKNLDKVLFLDVDTIILHSLKELYNTDIEGYYIAAALNPCIKAERDYVKEDLDKFPPIHYNTGVLLINLQKWREDNIEEKLLLTLNWYSKKYQRVPDQNALNIVCKEKIKKLNHKYNACPTLAFKQKAPWNYDSIDMLNEGFNDPYILHYASKRELKPWLNKNLPYAKFYWKYLKKTDFYEDFTFIDKFKNNIKNRIYMFKIKIKRLKLIFSII